jgi:hypothetical protein
MLRLISIAFAFLLPLAASAQDRGRIPCTDDGNCGISDIIGVLLNIAEFMLSIAGAVAFGFFVYAGFLYILGGANEENVKKSKAIITNAVIGIAIILTSGVLVRFTESALTGNATNVCLERTLKTPSGQECRPVIGNACQLNGTAIWISIPPGYTSPSNPEGTFVAESLECIVKDNCGQLNSILTSRNRHDLARYKCLNVDSPGVTSCVRGLCEGGANIACCLTN